MSIKRMRMRIHRLERIRNVDGPLTLEELCRLLWRDDREEYLKRVDEVSFPPYGFFVERFEREDREREGRNPGGVEHAGD